MCVHIYIYIHILCVTYIYIYIHMLFHTRCWIAPAEVCLCLSYLVGPARRETCKSCLAQTWQTKHTRDPYYSYVCMCVCISISLSIYRYIYIYTYMKIDRERERDRYVQVKMIVFAMSGNDHMGYLTL